MYVLIPLNTKLSILGQSFALLNKITEADMHRAMKLNEILFHLMHFISFCCRAEICLG